MCLCSGVVSNVGQEPVATGEAKEFLVTGPMCRYAQDLTPILKVLAAGNVHTLKLDQKVSQDIYLSWITDNIFLMSILRFFIAVTPVTKKRLIINSQGRILA